MTKLKTAAIYGALIGDACGVPYEFRPAHELPDYHQLDMIPPKDFNRTWASIPTGTFSDDGAQVLCLLETLLKSKDGNVDVQYLTESLQDWLRYGYMSVDGKTFDVGNQTSAALQYGSDNLNDVRYNGNGSLMRSIPVGLVSDSPNQIIHNSFVHSGITHPHMRSRVSCALYSLISFYMLQGKKVYDAYAVAVEDVKKFSETRHDVAEIIRTLSEIDDFQNHESTGTGYVVDCFWTSVKVVHASTSYEDAIKRAIAYGNDTDTTACVAGGLAGIKHGLDSIPSRWRKHLRGMDLINPLIAKMSARDYK